LVPSISTQVNCVKSVILCTLLKSVQKALVSVIRAQVANMEQKTVHRPSMVVTIAMLVNHRQRLGPVLRPFVLIALLGCTTLKQAKEHVRPVWLEQHQKQ